MSKKKFHQLKNAAVGSLQPQQGKYVLGKASDPFDRIKHLHPVFAFDYISMNSSGLCFNGKRGAKDYQSLLKGLKRISAHTYQTLNREPIFHFHTIDWDDTSVSEAEFLRNIGNDLDANIGITAYQCKVFEEARIVGFLYNGVFYLVFFDREHNIYKRK